jgi:hypothetical protein
VPAVTAAFVVVQIQDRDFFERFLVVFFLRVADVLRELDADFFADFFFEDFFFGTFLPSLRASERPMAMACFRLLTFLPLLPLFSVPFLRFFIVRATFFEAPLEYFLAMSGAPDGEYRRTNTRRAAWFRPPHFG